MAALDGLRYSLFITLHTSDLRTSLLVFVHFGCGTQDGGKTMGTKIMACGMLSLLLLLLCAVTEKPKLMFLLRGAEPLSIKP